MLERKGAAGRHANIPIAYDELIPRFETHPEPHLAAVGSRHYAVSVDTMQVRDSPEVVSFLPLNFHSRLLHSILWNWY